MGVVGYVIGYDFNYRYGEYEINPNNPVAYTSHILYGLESVGCIAEWEFVLGLPGDRWERTLSEIRAYMLGQDQEYDPYGREVRYFRERSIWD